MASNLHSKTTSRLSQFLRAALVVVIAYVVWRKFIAVAPTRPVLAATWHQSADWLSYLALYDQRAATQYQHCDNRLVRTSFGLTQLYACGRATDPVVLLLHGAGSSSLMYGDWLVPPLIATQHYVVAIDYICDVGRSMPLNGSVASCPRTREQLALWLRELLAALSLLPATTTTTTKTTTIALVGHSYGSFLAAQLTMAEPQLVSHLVMMAPAGVFAPLRLFVRNLVFVCRCVD